MYAAPFRYLAPTSIDEVVDLLAEHGDEATLLGGGQTLVPMMSLRIATPELLVDLGRVPRGEIRVADDHLVLPGSARHVDLLTDPTVARHAPMMRTAAAHIGNVRVRNRGTLGGSLAHADPAAEWPCVVRALEGVIRLTSRSGTRDVPAADFFDSYMSTARRPDEILTEVRIPIVADRREAFVEMTRRANDFAVVEVAAAAKVTAAGTFEDLQLVLGGVGERPVALGDAERAALRGTTPDDPQVAETLRGFVSQLTPSDNAHGSAAYRRTLAERLSLRALDAAVTA